MSPMTLIAVVRFHKQNDTPLDVLFRSGHHKRLSVRSVGKDWFSAQETGVLASELVVTLGAILFIGADIPELEQEHTSGSSIPLTAMLMQLERQHTPVIVHLLDHVLVGRVWGVGHDCVGLTRRDGTPVLIPLQALQWLEACG